ncbi:E4 [human papillomavirus 164]|uniref:E4 n=1 Tax=human papillomavirus 164 TaxID=1315261 RepID=K4MLD8_9PAPI|nr:E4 [human papillomavirus 164]
MKMDCFIMNSMVTECILHYLRQILQNMEFQESGLCIMKIQLLSPLPAPTGGSNNHHKPPSTNPLPPGTPRPSRRNADDRRPLQPHLPRVPRPLIFELGDEDSNKENEPLPYQREEEQQPAQHSPLSDLLSQLLQRWEQDIDSLRNKVLEDFDNFKQRLGIRTY